MRIVKALLLIALGYAAARMIDKYRARKSRYELNI